MSSLFSLCRTVPFSLITWAMLPPFCLILFHALCIFAFWDGDCRMKKGAGLLAALVNNPLLYNSNKTRGTLPPGRPYCNVEIGAPVPSAYTITLVPVSSPFKEFPVRPLASIPFRQSHLLSFVLLQLLSFLFSHRTYLYL